jgi:hypothetical protein
VDAIPNPADIGEPRSGFSFLLGAARHTNWTDAPSQGIQEADLAESGDVRSTLVFPMPPLVYQAPPVNVTLPLANTVFTTGKVSTTLSGTWHGSSRSQSWTWSWPPGLPAHMGELTIPSPLPAKSRGRVSIPLKSITAARKVISGLGNIVREVEIDGQACSASAELEAVIPRLLAEQENAGPMPVWALVIPEDAPDVKNVLEISELLNSPASAESRDLIFKALLAHGCRFHKICEYRVHALQPERH